MRRTGRSFALQACQPWPLASPAIDMVPSGSIGHQGIREAEPHFARGCQALAELGAEGMEFFDAGDDAVLFGERRQRRRNFSNQSNV